MRFYKCKKFRIEELVPPEVFSFYGERCWQFFRPGILITLDRMRWRYNKPITVNDWLWGGQFSYRGFRPPSCTIGADFSLHRFWGAIDCDVEGMPAEEVRQDILTNKDDPAFKEINCIEMGVNWVHFDARNVMYRIKKLKV